MSTTHSTAQRVSGKDWAKWRREPAKDEDQIRPKPTRKIQPAISNLERENPLTKKARLAVVENSIWRPNQIIAIMKKNQPISLLIIAALLAGCTTWGYKMPMGRTFPKTDYRMVKVLFNPPTDKHEEIGLCSVLGGAAFITSDVDMFQKLRKAAADMGADAVVVIREQSTRMSSMGGSGSAGAAWNQYGGSYGSSWGMGGSSIEYPRNTGMAIKYLDPSKQLTPKK